MRKPALLAGLIAAVFAAVLAYPATAYPATAQTVAPPTSSTSSATAAPLGSSDFIKADGSVLRTRSGTGAALNLRGTNLGGWLTQEDWMSPLGEFAVDRTGWTATSSGGTAPASTILDGSRTTQWVTPAGQAGTEWLRLDLGASTRFNRLTVDNSASPGNYPRHIVVRISTDGRTWTSVADQDGTDGVSTASFIPQLARYVRIDQTATAQAPWSVSEVDLFADATLSDAGRTATASTSAPGFVPAAAVDGDVSTVWQSGTPQRPGQSFTVDFGRNIDMTKVLIDSGAATSNDYPRVWDLFTSYDNVNFTRVANGFGTNRIVQADLQAWRNTRYLRIVSDGTADQWWSIADIAVYSGNNLDRSTWTVTASTGSGAGNVTDGTTDTRWTTGAPQTPGQWIQVDLGALVTLNNVSTDTTKNSTGEGDWPRGYTLQLSRDGSTWTTVATGAGTVKATTIGFVAQAARYFRLTQTASAPQWWSIGELSAGLYNDDYSLTNTLTARFGTAGAQTVIDTHQDTWLQTSDLDNIAAAGLNYVRVPMSWNTFLNLDGTWKPNPWRKLDWLVAQASQRGIYVLLDLHTAPGGACSWGSCGRYGPTPNGFWGSPIDQDWTQSIWQAIATHFKGNPGVAGYDLMNEPLIDANEDAADHTQKNDLYNRLYQAVRAIDPDHLIVLGAFPGLDAIAQPAAYGWTNVMYELHPYDMSNPTDWTAQNQLVTNELAALPGRLADYDVPFLEGEFSLYYDDDVWARFLAGLNAANVSWSNWTYKVTGTADGGFAYWGMYYDDQQPQPVINSDDQATFVAKLQQFGTTHFTRNTELVATVKKYAGALSTYAPVELAHDGWTATASSSTYDSFPASGIDGVNGAAWYSGLPQASGQWYQIDMGASHTVAMISIQTAQGFEWDYPRGLNVDVSTDGTQWVRVATTTAHGWKRTIAIPPTMARYLRLTQTGTSPRWWSIDQVGVYSSF